MLTRLGNRNGFSLIELMIIVAILGVLSALAIPRFFNTTGKAKKVEAKMILKQIYKLERAYYMEFDAYKAAANTAALVASGLPIEDPGADARYDYSVTVAGINFTAIATEIGDADGDGTPNEQITMDQDGVEGGDWQ